MDIEKFLDTLSDSEKAQIIAGIPDEIFMSEAVRRGKQLVETMGITATIAAQETDIPKTEFELRVANFLTSGTKQEAGDQLFVMSEFWDGLGYVMPALNKHQITKLSDKLNEHPLRRVVPAPLLDPKVRQNLEEQTGNLRPKRDKSFPDRVSDIYNSLLDDPSSSPRDQTGSYKLLYNSPKGELLNRPAYLESLLEAGQAVKAEDGVMWVFPVMDIGYRNNSNSGVSTRIGLINPVATPESLFALHRLHQINNTDLDNQDARDPCNEAVWQLEQRRTSSQPINLAHIISDSKDKIIRFSFTYQSSNLPQTMRNVESGI